MSWLLILLFRAVTGKVSKIVPMSYARIFFEHWAYGSTKLGTLDYRWPHWVGGFFLCLLFTGLVLAIPIGLASGVMAVWIAGLIDIVALSLIRALTTASIRI